LRYTRSFAALLLLAIPVDEALGLVITDQSLTVSAVGITSASGVAVIDPWTADASASASNSLGQSSGQFDTSLGLATAVGNVTFATVSAQANALDLTATVTAAAVLPGPLSQAATDAFGTLSTFFSITGGTGPVDMTLSIHLTGTQHAVADAIGLFRNVLSATLELDGAPLLFREDLLQGGPNFPAESPSFTADLVTTQTLSFDTAYFVVVSIDGELRPNSRVPEPNNLALLLLGLGVLIYCRGSRSLSKRTVEHRA
jgi:hypothetical protein